MSALKSQCADCYTLRPVDELKKCDCGDGCSAFICRDDDLCRRVIDEQDRRDEAQP